MPDSNQGLENQSNNHLTRNPAIAYDISDRTLTSLLSSSPLHHLTTTSITAYETARRLGYGAPQRIMVETSGEGPVLLQSYMNPHSILPQRLFSDEDNTNGYLNDLLDVGRPSTGISQQTTELAHPQTNGFEPNRVPLLEEDSNESAATQPPPTLFATVVVPRRTDLREGRIVAMRMEQLGRQFQREWVMEQQAEREHAERQQVPRERSADDGEDG